MGLNYLVTLKVTQTIWHAESPEEAEQVARDILLNGVHRGLADIQLMSICPSEERCYKEKQQ